MSIRIAVLSLYHHCFLTWSLLKVDLCQSSAGHNLIIQRCTAQVEEQVPLAAAEIYLFTWRGTLIFLPGLPWLPMGRWHLPEKEMDALATSLRKVARLLWALHLSFLDGFDEVRSYFCSSAHDNEEQGCSFPAACNCMGVIHG